MVARWQAHLACLADQTFTRLRQELNVGRTMHLGCRWYIASTPDSLGYRLRQCKRRLTVTISCLQIGQRNWASLMELCSHSLILNAPAKRAFLFLWPSRVQHSRKFMGSQLPGACNIALMVNLHCSTCVLLGRPGWCAYTVKTSAQGSYMMMQFGLSGHQFTRASLQ